MFAKRYDVMTAFDALEKITRHMEDDDGSWQEPAFDVRLDGKRELEERSYRIRVSAGSGTKAPTIEEWRKVLEIAEAHEAHVRIDNGAIELQ